MMDIDDVVIQERFNDNSGLYETVLYHRPTKLKVDGSGARRGVLLSELGAKLRGLVDNPVKPSPYSFC